MFLKFLALLKEIRWNDLVDIAIAALLLWTGIQGLRTARARAAGIGLLVLGGIFLLARQFQLELTVWLLQGIAALLLLLVVVVFQDEIRTLFERIPQFFSRQRQAGPIGYVTEPLAETMAELVERRWGALVVLPGRTPLGALLKGGVRLDGYLSKPLLMSLFDPNSPGHDGAVVVEGRRIARFAVHLPLSSATAKLAGRGTRHAAALGLSERSDAIILVVSEESGRVSVAREGSLHTLTQPAEVTAVIAEHQRAYASPATRSVLGRLLRRGGLEGLAAVLLALILWLAMVPGSVVDTATFKIPVNVLNVPGDFALEEVIPPKVEVTLTGPRRSLILFDAQKVSIPLDATLAALGRRSFTVTPGQMLLPPELAVINLSPDQVRLRVRKAGSEPSRQE